MGVRFFRHFLSGQTRKDIPKKGALVGRPYENLKNDDLLLHLLVRHRLCRRLSADIRELHAVVEQTLLEERLVVTAQVHVPVHQALVGPSLIGSLGDLRLGSEELSRVDRGLQRAASIHADGTDFVPVKEEAGDCKKKDRPFVGSQELRESMHKEI